MKCFWIGIFVIFLCFSRILGHPHNVRIVDGVNASMGEFPYAVSIRYNDCHECGGAIIGDRWVLTAAHCVFSGFINLLTVLYGTTDSQNCQATTNFTKKVKRAIINSNYQPYDGYFNDIAVIEVEEPFTFSEYAQPVKLPSQGKRTPVFEDAILVGWGYPHVDGQVMPNLQKVDITIFPDEYCSMFFTSNFSAVSHICAGVPNGGKGQCTGDSGGALTVNGTQYGVVSWSDKPCASTPGVLTRVASYRDWITDITGI